MKARIVLFSIVLLASVLGTAAAMEMGSSPADRELMAVMSSMSASMDRAALTGDPDKDFLRAMISHHKGAIEMAKVELKHGTDPKVRALARQIISAQTREVKEMTGWLK